MYCRQYEKRCAGVQECDMKCLHYQRCEALYNEGYRKQSEVVDEFAERLKETPIKCGLPLFGLSTKEEIEEYFDGIMLQVRDTIDSIAKEMKGGAE
jgi:hypothetical protein